jgi:hypothetical protein
MMQREIGTPLPCYVWKGYDDDQPYLPQVPQMTHANV